MVDILVHDFVGVVAVLFEVAFEVVVVVVVTIVVVVLRGLATPRALP
jgi:hypothetical protein